jgi:hypothetical protein
MGRVTGRHCGREKSDVENKQAVFGANHIMEEYGDRRWVSVSA